MLLKTGISNILETKTKDIKLNFQKYENQIKSETAKKVRLEIDQKKNQDYIEKVKQIRHDIRSPLSSIQSAYELLNKNDLPSKSIATAIRRIQILIDDLNQVDRVLEESKFLIAEVSLEEIVLVLKSKFKSQKNADLVFKYNEDSLTAIKVREQDFMSAVENLLENSLDAIGVNGKVLIKVENQNQSCIITVEDSGSGVRSENISNLFSKGATFDKANGIGLGLYNTKKIIESFGGNIRYIEQSQGAKFEIKLPIVQTGVVFVSLPKNQTLKVIDDDNFIPESLKKLGYPISEYVNTFEAGKVLLVENQSDDELILVDNRLGLNKFGTELIGQQLRRKNIILCTNDFDDMDLIKQAKAIGVKVLPKPLIFLRQAEAVSSPTNPI